MPLDIRALISAHAGDASALHEAHVNPRLAKALSLIGFDRTYGRGSGPLVQLDEPVLCGLLTQEFKRRCERDLERVYFCSTGSEATETAMKLARRATGRNALAGGSSSKRKATA